MKRKLLTEKETLKRKRYAITIPVYIIFRILYTPTRSFLFFYFLNPGSALEDYTLPIDRIDVKRELRR